MGIALGTWGRLQYLDLSYSLYFTQFVYISNGKRPVQELWTALRPFSPEVWAWIVASLVAAAALLKVLDFTYHKVRPIKKENGSNWHQIFDCEFKASSRNILFF